ncbi:MAG: hypothetical protein ABID83_05275 [Candidatus Omnitrophota bacterium]
MKYVHGKLFVLLFLVVILSLSVSAHSEEKRKKGVMIKLWERITSRWGEQKKPIEEEKKAEAKKREPLPQEEKIKPVVKETAPVEKKVEVPEETEPTQPVREIPFSKQEMIDVIEKRLEIYSEIIYMISGLSFEETEDGGKGYFYETSEGDIVKLSDLDKETLHGLFVRVNNEATRISSERLMQQLQQQEQIIRSIQHAPQQPPRTYTPPQPPRIYTPPQQPAQPPQIFTPPQQPAQPPQPPQQPTPPPQPPAGPKGR